MLLSDYQKPRHQQLYQATDSKLLPVPVQDEELIVHFNESCTKLGIADPVDAVRVVRDSASQLGKGFGFVQFSSQQAARAALGCDGQLLRKRPIRVTKAMKVSASLKQLGQKQKQQKFDRGKSVTGSAKPVPDTGEKTIALWSTAGVRCKIDEAAICCSSYLE